MCGIAGFSGRFSKKLLYSMNSILSHRGPDDNNILYLKNKQVGLSHNRLSIIDLSPTGRQPMWDSTKSVVVVFNGEIYNYRELRKELLADGFSFNGRSDTEVILNLYLRDSTNLLQQLDGIFAFAIWDNKKDSLFLARDGLGVKPLYFASTSEGFLFASEIKALLQSSAIDKILDPISINQYLTYLWAPAPRTILKQVKKLEPGYALTVKHGEIENKWKYYDLPYTAHKLFEEDPITEEEATDEIVRLLSQAVSRQMVADVEVGAFLSGGLDSSAIACFANKHLSNNKLQCFTIGSKDSFSANEGMPDDLPFAKQVASHLGVNLHTIYIGSEIINDLQKMIYHLDEPQADPAPLNVLLISQLARKHGIKVLLSGAGGDDFFTGYRRHYALTLEKYWQWLPYVGRKLLATSAKLVPPHSPAGRRFAKAFQYADFNKGNQRIASYFHWNTRNLLSGLYSNSFSQELAQYNHIDALVESLDTLPQGVHPLNKMLYLDAKHFLTDHNLNYTDKMSMAASVEVRVPFLDPNLINFACKLPVKFKQNGKHGKWILKKAMEPFLPKNVIYRPKTGFGAPLRYWLNTELRPMVDEYLSETSIKKRGIFDPKEVAKLVADNRQGKIDGAYAIFSIMCIEMWCQIFADKISF